MRKSSIQTVDEIYLLLIGKIEIYLNINLYSMQRNRNNRTLGLMVTLIGCLLFTCASAQSSISKIWTSVDNNLRANAPDEYLRNILIGAKLRAVVPTSGGMILVYTLVDED